MKKLLRIDASVVANILRGYYNGEGVWQSDTVVEYLGADFGESALLFTIEHEDIVKDVEVLAEIESTDEEEVDE